MFTTNSSQLILLFLPFNYTLFFRIVLDTQQNWAEIVESVYVYLPPTNMALPTINIAHQSNAIVITHEPTLTPHCHQSSQFTVGFSLCAVHSVGFHECIVTCMYRIVSYRRVSLPYNPLCSGCLPFLPSLLATGELVTVSQKVLLSWFCLFQNVM